MMEEAQVVGLLVRRCVGGDAAAWEEIVQRHHRRIYNICYRFAGDSENAQDLTQEVFIKIYRTLKSYDVGRGALVDQPALVVALSTGRLLGAGLDTLEQEPPAADDPLA